MRAPTFDELRALYPDLGFAIYAFEPRGAVTLEVIDPISGNSISSDAPTLTRAISQAFRDRIDDAIPAVQPETPALFAPAPAVPAEEPGILD